MLELAILELEMLELETLMLEALDPELLETLELAALELEMLELETLMLDALVVASELVWELLLLVVENVLVPDDVPLIGELLLELAVMVAFRL